MSCFKRCLSEKDLVARLYMFSYLWLIPSIREGRKLYSLNNMDKISGNVIFKRILMDSNGFPVQLRVCRLTFRKLAGKKGREGEGRVHLKLYLSQNCYNIFSMQKFLPTLRLFIIIIIRSVYF
jgi:hypothetical protein